VIEQHRVVRIRIDPYQRKMRKSLGRQIVRGPKYPAGPQYSC
jgi:hypothetical protein